MYFKLKTDNAKCKLLMFSTRKFSEVVIWFNPYKKQKEKFYCFIYRDI